MTEQFANFAQSSLTSSISASQTVITVASASSFPLLGNFRIVAQTFDPTTNLAVSQPEIMLVTAVSSNNFTVTRGVENTIARAYAAGTFITHIITAAVMTALSGGGGTVTSVSGTIDRITSTGGTTPVIDIASTYIGQNSITTVGRIQDGTWNADPIDLSTYASGNLPLANIEEGNGVLGTSGNLFSTPAYNGGSANQVLRYTSAGFSWGFGSINLASSAAVTGRLVYANIAQLAANSFLGNATAGTADIASVCALSASQLAGRGSTGNLAAISLGGHLAITTTTLDVDLTRSYAWTGAHTWNDNNFALFNPAKTFQYNFRTSAIAANRDITLPLLTANDTFDVLGLAQTFSATKTFDAGASAGIIVNTSGSKNISLQLNGVEGAYLGNLAGFTGLFCPAGGASFFASPDASVYFAVTDSTDTASIQGAAFTVSVSASTFTGLVTFNSGISLAAGTASVAPIKLASGTNLTSAASGAIEYDGSYFYLTNSTPTRYFVPLYKTGRATAQTTANASVVTFTPTADSTWLISANVLVTTSTLHNFTVTCAYTDEGNTARVLTLQFSNLAGTFLTAIANTAGAVPYEGVPVQIRAKANTPITIASAAGGTYTTVTYNIEGAIVRVV